MHAPRPPVGPVARRPGSAVGLSLGTGRDGVPAAARPNCSPRRPPGHRAAGCRAPTRPGSPRSSPAPSAASPSRADPSRPGASARLASESVPTSTSRSAGAEGRRSRVPTGTSRRPNPSRSASATRSGISGTGRTAPDSATSPIATTSSGIGCSRAAERIARHTARSAAGSRSRMPATVARKMSWSYSRCPATCSLTAISMALRLVSMPVTPRRGVGLRVCASRACTSASSARLPSTATLTQVPGTGSSRCSRNSTLGSGTSAMPDSVCSNAATSSAPNRFLTVRSSRSEV